MTKFPERLRRLRQDRGLSQSDLGGEIGVAQSTVGMWESGKREPDFETLIKLARFFGVSVAYLLGADEKPVVLAMRGFLLPPPGAEHLTPEELEEIYRDAAEYHEYIVRKRLKEKGIEV